MTGQVETCLNRFYHDQSGKKRVKRSSFFGWTKKGKKCGQIFNDIFRN